MTGFGRKKKEKNVSYIQLLFLCYIFENMYTFSCSDGYKQYVPICYIHIFSVTCFSLPKLVFVLWAFFACMFFVCNGLVLFFFSILFCLFLFKKKCRWTFMKLMIWILFLCFPPRNFTRYIYVIQYNFVYPLLLFERYSNRHFPVVVLVLLLLVVLMVVDMLGVVVVAEQRI